jgi:hypothetical protein
MVLPRGAFSAVSDNLMSVLAVELLLDVQVDYNADPSVVPKGVLTFSLPSENRDGAREHLRVGAKG